MLAGVGGIDAVLLVVAADESRDAADARALRHLPAAARAARRRRPHEVPISPTPTRARWSGSTSPSSCTGSFLDDAPVIAVSARTGDGLDALRDAIAARWPIAVPARGRRRRRAPAHRPRVLDEGLRHRRHRHARRRAASPWTTSWWSLPGGRDGKVRGVQVHGARRDRRDGRTARGAQPRRRRGRATSSRGQTLLPRRAR